MEKILSVRLTGDTDDLNKSMAQAAKGIDVFAASSQQAANTAAVSFTKIGNSMKGLVPQIGASKKAIEELKASLNNSLSFKSSSIPDIVPASTASRLKAAGNAAVGTRRDFTGLSRVLQDLPFGFIAVQNNIEQLLPAAGGAGLAISAITSALTFATIGFDNWTRGFDSTNKKLEEHKKKLEKAKEAIELYIDSLDDISKASLNGAQSAQEQLVSLQTLYKATQDANVPLSERKKLVDDLQSQYPKYFKNISDETILAGGAEAAYKKLSTAILQSARARAAQEELVSIQKDSLVLERQLTDAMTEEFKTSTALQKLKAGGLNKNASEFNVGAAASANVLQNAQAINSAQDQYNEKSKKTTEIYKQLNDLRERGKALSEDILRNIEQNGADVLIDPKIKTPEARDKSQFNFFDKFFDTKPAKDHIEKQLKEMADTAREFASKNFQIFQGLDVILAAPDQASLIAEGKKFWNAYQKGLVKLKPPRVDVGALEISIPEIKAPVMPDASKIFGDFGKIDLKISSIDIAGGEALAKKDQQFVDLGRQIGDRVGNGFGEYFSKRFSSELNIAFAQGISGKELDGLKDQLAAVAQIDTAIFAGLGDSVQSFTTAILQGQNGLVAFGDSFRNMLTNIISKLAEAAVFAGVLSLIIPGGGTWFAQFTKLLGGLPGHKGGLDFVPKDDYVARLHYGEMVLTKEEATAYRKAISSSLSGSRLDFGQPNNYSIETVSPVVITGNWKLRGSEMHLMLAREERSRRRTS